MNWGSLSRKLDRGLFRDGLGDYEWGGEDDFRMD
jgi:hypothetical protein